MKAARKFTRDDPCTKVEIHNCFFDGHRYNKKAVVDAKMEIGDNVPKYLTREGFMDTLHHAGVDYFVLTGDGEDWLRDGLARFLTLHPERTADVRGPKLSRRIRRAIAPAEPAKPPTMRRIIRGRG